MGIRDVASTLAHVPLLLKMKKELEPRPLEERDSIGSYVARNAERYGNQPAYSFEGEVIGWEDFNQLANRYAHTFAGHGLARGDTASLFMENRIQFLAAIIALNKLGVVAGLINTNLTGRPLVHCVSTTESKICIVGEERIDAIDEIREELTLSDGDFFFVSDGGDRASPEWARDLDEAAAAANAANPASQDQTQLGENALYIFTSGTTGLPKAAIMSNRRYLTTATLAALGGLRLNPSDRMYNCLPLYHATGLVVGIGAGLVSGASTFIRRKFSASRFTDEVRSEGTTHMIYIGELCRYLMNTEASPSDAGIPLHTMMGNGLRPDVWMDFKSRFGLKRIAELYGASEGNAGFLNFLNKDCTIGTTTFPVRLVQYDVHDDRIVKDNAGRCIDAPEGEPGLALIQVTPDARFEGYTNPEATEKKVIRGAFEDEDVWFNTGDLLRTVDVGFALGFTHYQFVDRVGDTFRWKSENVSTNEVGEIINMHADVAFSNVYGVEVPGADGRAGMAALLLADGKDTVDVESLSAHVNAELPPYARPVFLRLQQDIDVTGTFKMVKGDLREQGYDLSKVSDPLLVMLPGSTEYVPLDEEIAAKIASGQAGF